VLYLGHGRSWFYLNLPAAIFTRDEIRTYAVMPTGFITARHLMRVVLISISDRVVPVALRARIHTIRYAKCLYASLDAFLLWRAQWVPHRSHAINKYRF
jgi:hypothetical protein